MVFLIQRTIDRQGLCSIYALYLLVEIERLTRRSEKEGSPQEVLVKTVDLVQMMAERGILLAHTTILGWVMAARVQTIRDGGRDDSGH
jgi:hypothetical protein